MPYTIAMPKRKAFPVEDVCMMLMLLKTPLHGYELVEELRRRKLLRHNPAQIYRKLREMEREGYLESEWVVQDTGRPRRVYRLKEEGVALLKSCCTELKTFLREARVLLEEVEGSAEEPSPNG